MKLSKILCLVLMLALVFTFAACQTTAMNYTVDFDSNGGSAVPSQTVASGKYAVEPASPTREGYVFNGWYLPTGTAWNFTNDKVSGNIKLIADWEEIPAATEYTISYYDGSTKLNLTPNKYTEDSTGLTLPAAPAKAHYEFEGWFKNAAMTLPAVGIDVNSESDLAFFAKYVPNEYTISYELDGGTNSKNNKTDYTVSSIPTLYDPTKEGYTFEGWYTDAAFENEITEITLDNAGDLILYAKWEKVWYNITYIGLNGAQVSGLTPDKYQSPTQPINLPSLDVPGYNFMGWQLNGVDTAVIPAGTTGNITLTAKLEKIIVYHNLTYMVDGAQYGETVKFNDEVGVAVLAAPNKLGHTFSGWTLNGNPVTSIPANHGADVVLVGTFTPVYYNITYVGLNGEEISGLEPAQYIESESDVTLPAYTLEGYNFLGWTIDGKDAKVIKAGTKGDITVTAKLEKIIVYYNLTYMLNGEQYEDVVKFDNEVGVPELKAPEKTGYAFSGWTLNGNPVTSIPANNGADVVLEGTLTPVYYSITYIGLNGEEITGLEPSQYMESTSDIALPPYSVDGYDFMGWTINGDITTVIKAGTKGDITLTAELDIADYTLTYMIDGEQYGATVSFKNDEGVTTLVAPTKLGYEFSGWMLNGELVTSIPAFINGNVTLEGSFAPVYHSITYIGLNGEEITGLEPSTYMASENNIDLPEYSINGYNFISWSIDGVNVSYIKAGTAKDLVITAVLEAKTYELTYMLDGAEYDVVRFKNDAGVPTLAAPTKLGYSFSGWMLNGEIVTSIPANIGKDVVVNGSFTPVYYSITYIGLDGAEITGLEPTQYIESATDIHLPAYELEGYAFMGWNIGGVDTTVIKAGTKGDITVTAKLEKDVVVYNLVYMLNGTQYGTTIKFKDEEGVPSLEDPTRLGYEFSGWMLNGTVVTSIPANYGADVTLEATNVAIVYNITYSNDVESGTYTVDDTVTLPVLPDTVAERFLGWQIDGEGDVIKTIPQGSTGDINLVAVFEDITYKITYHLLGGENDSKNAETYNPNSIPTLHAPLNREGYLFAGWYTNASFEGEAVSNLADIATGDITLYAKWVEITNDNGGGSTMTPEAPM